MANSFAGAVNFGKPDKRPLAAKPGDERMPAIRPKTEILWASTSSEGKQLLLNSKFNGLGYDLITIIADDADESLWVEVFTDGQRVQFPLGIFQEMAELAPGNVHSETWYENNMPECSEPGLNAAARAILKRGPTADD